MTDRYLKFVLTLIALELLWLSLNGASRPLSAQAAATPVVITGIHLETGDGSPLPVAVRGTVTIAQDAPLKIEADRPLPVESVPFTPSVRPGQ